MGRTESVKEFFENCSTMKFILFREEIFGLHIMRQKRNHIQSSALRKFKIIEFTLTILFIIRNLSFRLSLCIFCKLDCIFILVWMYPYISLLNRLYFVSNMLNIITQLKNSLILMQLYVPHVDQMLAMSHSSWVSLASQHHHHSLGHSFH